MVSFEAGTNLSNSLKRKRIAITIFLLIVLIAISLAILQMPKLVNELFTNKNIILKTDNIFSPIITEEIRNLLNSELSPRGLIPQFCINTQKLYPCIKKIDVRLLGSGKFLLKIYANSPIIILSNTHNGQEYILAENEIFNKSNYKAYMLENLYKININTPNILNIKSDLLKLNTIPSYILENYHITWHDDTKIILNSKTNNNYFIVAHTDSLFTNKVKLAEKIYINSAKNKKLKIDIRFKKFIVCAHLKGVVNEN